MAHAPSLSRPSARRETFFRRAFHHLTQALALRRHRSALGKLDPHILRDIGLTQAQAEAEASRPLWDVPEHWLK
jgi:uncharacterized protein YjiS (DUF1127 family)